MSAHLPLPDSLPSPANRHIAHRRPALDGIRALAFIGVLLSHVRVPFTAGGGIGVDVFFVLSGFLITGILLGQHERTHALQLGRFYLRRAARLLPALYVVVAVFSAYALVVQRAHRPSPHHLLVSDALVLFYGGNWLRAFHGQNAIPWFGHTWSLSIEEQFYVLWPLVMIIVLKWRGALGVFIAAVAGSVASLVTSVSLVSFAHASSDRIYNGTDTNADLLLTGCALAAAMSLRPELVRKVCRILWLPGVFILLVGASDLVIPWRMTVGYAIIAISAASLIGFVWCEPQSLPARFLSARPLPAIGLISYGLYLWHYPILLAVEGHVSGFGLRLVAVAVPTFVAAYLSWRFIETPVLRMAAERREDDRPQIAALRWRNSRAGA